MVTVIIDDDHTAARHLAECLRKYDGVTVAGVADNGLDGLALINRHKPDLLFLSLVPLLTVPQLPQPFPGCLR